MNHTKTPWVVGNNGKGAGTPILENGVIVASAFGRPLAESEANAAFIAQACNNHEKLVEALKGIIDYAENEAAAIDDLKDCEEAEEEARVAIEACEVARSLLESLEPKSATV